MTSIKDAQEYVAFSGPILAPTFSPFSGQLTLEGKLQSTPNWCSISVTSLDASSPPDSARFWCSSQGNQWLEFGEEIVLLREDHQRTCVERVDHFLRYQVAHQGRESQPVCVANNMSWGQRFVKYSPRPPFVTMPTSGIIHYKAYFIHRSISASHTYPGLYPELYQGVLLLSWVPGWVTGLCCHPGSTPILSLQSPADLQRDRHCILLANYYAPEHTKLLTVELSWNCTTSYFIFLL